MSGWNVTFWTSGNGTVRNPCYTAKYTRSQNSGWLGFWRQTSYGKGKCRPFLIHDLSLVYLAIRFDIICSTFVHFIYINSNPRWFFLHTNIKIKLIKMERSLFKLSKNSLSCWYISSKTKVMEIGSRKILEFSWKSCLGDFQENLF